MFKIRKKGSVVNIENVVMSEVIWLSNLSVNFIYHESLKITNAYNVSFPNRSPRISLKCLHISFQKNSGKT